MREIEKQMVFRFEPRMNPEKLKMNTEEEVRSARVRAALQRYMEKGVKGLKNEHRQ